ncbi:MAG: GNAT family N-acetyltransferase, partial [Ruminococcus sp.]|nr:GNAT family N-acetyltransferase [Ruminococcus sp.]
VNCETNEDMLKFVVVDPAQRGKGYGTQMVRLAAQYCYDRAKAELVHLNVFTTNAAARRCYESAGFPERNTTPDAFTYNGESWGRCNMTIMRDKLPICR